MFHVKHFSDPQIPLFHVKQYTGGEPWVKQ